MWMVVEKVKKRKARSAAQESDFGTSVRYLIEFILYVIGKMLINKSRLNYVLCCRVSVCMAYQKVHYDLSAYIWHEYALTIALSLCKMKIPEV